MAGAGADILVAHMGLTTGGAIGAETALTLDAVRSADPGRSTTLRAKVIPEVWLSATAAP